MVSVTRREIVAENRAAVLALGVADAQHRFVGSIEEALDDAAEFPEGNPYRELGLRPADERYEAGEVILSLDLLTLD